MGRSLVFARNVAIIALLAAGVALVPGGDDAAGAAIATLTLAFAIAIGLSLHMLWRRSGLTLVSLNDRQRVVLYSAVAAIILMFAAADEMLGTGLGALAWIAVLVASGMAIYTVWREASTY